MERMRDIIVNEILIPSISTLYKRDFANIYYKVSERNICARLAHHMENIMRKCDHSDVFRGYYADVEYNRMGDGNTKHYEDNQHRPQYMVSDLLIHNRGRNPNYLAVEMKHKENHKNIETDKERLSALTSPWNENTALNCVCGTLVGAFITYSCDNVKVELYENVNGHGEKTEEMNFVCRRGGNRFLSLEQG